MQVTPRGSLGLRVAHLAAAARRVLATYPRTPPRQRQRQPYRRSAHCGRGQVEEMRAVKVGGSGFCLAVLGKSRTRRGAGGVSLAVWRMWARVVSRRQPTRDSMRLDPVVSPGRAVDCHRRLLSFAIRGVSVTDGLVAPQRLLWIRTPAKRLEQPSDRQPRVTNLESRAAHKQRGVSSPHAQPRRLLS